MGVSLHELTFLAYAASKQEGRGLGKCMTLGDWASNGMGDQEIRPLIIDFL